MEIKREVKTIEVDFECPSCDKGKMRPTGIALLCQPALYPHKCKNCNYILNLDKTYPYIEYKTI